VEAPALGFAQSAAIDPVRSEVWVSDGSTPPSLQAYALVDIYSGQPGIAPVRTISGAASLLDQGVEGIAVDATNGEIAVALNAASSVIVFDAAANGSNVAPKRIVAGVASPHGVALDPVHDELWISSPAGLSVFARTADGTPAPIRTVTGPATGLDDPGSLALDLVDDEVTVMNRTWGAGLATFARTASGNAVPQRTISGRAEGINLPTAIAADPVTGEIFVANHAPDVVTVHAHGASGAGGPVRTLNLAANKLLVDAAHRELLAVSAGALLVYPLTATGNDPPARTIPTPAPVRGIAIAGDEILVSDGFSTVYVLGRDGTLLSSFSTGFARELAYDSTTDEVAVQGNATDPFWITFYSRSGGSPRRSIPLEHFGPFGVSLALDSITGDTWILVSEPEAQNPSLGRIAIYPRDSGAAGAMVRSIEGPASGMVEPSAITFCP
jgi:hypothetical protein